MTPSLSRRQFLEYGTAALTTGLLLQDAAAAEKEPIIDIHQHTHYHGRTDEQMIKHQRAMGVTTTILLPSGTPVKRPSTHDGRSNGLEAKTGGNDTVMAMAKKYPKEFIFGANEVPDLPGMQKELEKYLKAGAVIIAEQKFKVECDSKYVWAVAEVAQEFGVPVLMHFQHNSYNLNFDRFHRTLEKFPKVNFIGHAQMIRTHHSLGFCKFNFTCLPRMVRAQDSKNADLEAIYENERWHPSWKVGLMFLTCAFIVIINILKVKMILCLVHKNVSDMNVSRNT